MTDTATLHDTSTLMMLLGLLAIPSFAALTYAVAVGGRALSAWLQARAKGSVVMRELVVLEEVVMAIVTDIEANERVALQERPGGPTAPLTLEDAKKLKELALARVKGVLLAKGMDSLRAMLGGLVDTSATLDMFLSGRVEQAVAKLPSRGTPAVAAIATASPA